MNASILIVVVMFVFVMGYRFYTKFLVLGVFRSEDGAPTPAWQHPDSPDFSPCNRWQLLGYNAAASAGLVSITGVGIAMIWGWIPAFLWIIVGTLVAGGTYALATLWASLRQSGNTLAGIAFDTAGVWAALPMFFLGIALVVFLGALTCVLLGQLLQAHPEASWIFLSLAAAPGLIWRSASSRSITAKFLWVSAALGLLAAGLILGQEYPLHFSGESTLVINGIEVFRLPGETPLVAVALALAYHAIGTPISGIARYRGIIVAILLIVLMLVTGAGLLLSAPPVVAPDFNLDAALPNAFPLLFLVVSGGAVSGVYALVLTGTTVRQIEQARDAPLISYGSVMLDGILAVLVLVVLSAGFTTTGEWSSMYDRWPEHAGVLVWLDLAVTKMGRFMAATGIPVPIAVGIVASVFAGMALTMLDSLLRALSYAVDEFVNDFELAYLRGNRYRDRIAAGIIVFATLWLLQVDLGLNHWLFFGLANQLFAGCFLLVLSLILFRSAIGAAFVLLPTLFVLTLALWGLGWLVINWWQQGEWILFTLTCIVGFLAIVSLAACTSAFLKVRQRRAATGAPGN